MLEKVKIRLASLGILNGIEDTSQDAVLSLMISDTTDAVCSYCHRKTLPSGLEHLVRDVVVRTVRTDNEGNVSSIKRGDTQINYASTVTVDSFTGKDTAVLNTFRVLRIG